MPETSPRQSPIHPWHQARQPVWGRMDEMPIPFRFQAFQAEQEAVQTLALCDLSGLAKLGVKGRDSQPWLAHQGIDVPAKIYQSSRLADGGLVVRLATDEFLLESGVGNQSVPTLAARLSSSQGRVFRVERQEATFLLLAARSLDVLAQTCGIDFRQAPLQQLVLTRVAGVSCGVLPDRVNDTRAYRLWVDFTCAIYLWEVLVEICEELDGRVIGAASIFPELR